MRNGKHSPFPPTYSTTLRRSLWYRHYDSPAINSHRKTFDANESPSLALFRFIRRFGFWPMSARKAVQSVVLAFFCCPLNSVRFLGIDSPPDWVIVFRRLRAVRSASSRRRPPREHPVPYCTLGSLFSPSYPHPHYRANSYFIRPLKREPLPPALTGDFHHPSYCMYTGMSGYETSLFLVQIHARIPQPRSCLSGLQQLAIDCDRTGNARGNQPPS